MTPGSLIWIARHELKLAWRDTSAMLRAGQRGPWRAIVALLVFTLVLHAVAFFSLRPLVGELMHPDKGLYLMLTGSAFLSWTLLFSQAMETVTRAFYARADLDLLLSSPTPARRIFTVRLAVNAMNIVVMALLLVGPAIDAMALLCGPRFLMGYGVLVAMALSATGAAAAFTAVLFRVCGPARSRLIAQVVAAIIGAGFVVVIQICAIASSGTMSRIAMWRSPHWIAAAPDLQSPVWWSVRAAFGDVLPLAAVLMASVVLLLIALVTTAPALAAGAVRSSEADLHKAKRVRAVTFRRRSAVQVLRRKELALLVRDPWLVSQSLMQLLYLIPPAVLLWRDCDGPIGGLQILVPVLVMATGQLAGGLAWLAVSGEDAPDLIATAPVSSRAVLWAKIEAVTIAVLLPMSPMLLGLLFAFPVLGIIAMVGVVLAIGGASAIQYVFRSQAKRSNFRRRQTSSRFATFAEAFFSILLAAASGFAAAQAWWIAGVLVVAAFLIVAFVAFMASTERKDALPAGAARLAPTIP